jgi:hypothetical protein
MGTYWNTFAVSAVAIVSSFTSLPPANAYQNIEMTRLASGYYTVPVKIDGQGPWPFVLDTGASDSLLAQSLATEFGYVSVPPSTDVQTLTERYRAQSHVLNNVSLDPITAPSLEMVISPVPESTLPFAVGLLGADLFDQGGDVGVLTRIDFPNSILELSPPAVEHVDAIISQEFNLVFASATVNGRSARINALIDSGSPFTIVNSQAADLIERFNTPGRVSLSDFSDRVRFRGGENIRTTQLRVGGLCVGPVYVIEANVDVFRALGWSQAPAMIIGTDVLESAQITLNRISGQVQIDQGVERSRLCNDERVQRPN